MSSQREIDPSTPLRWRSLRDMTPEERARFDERERQIRETLRHQPIAEIRLKIYAPEEGRDAEVYWEVRHPSEMLASSQVRPPSEIEPYRFTRDQLREIFVRALDGARQQLGQENSSPTHTFRACVFCGRREEDGARIVVQGGGMFAPWLCAKCLAIIAPSADTAGARMP